MSPKWIVAHLFLAAISSPLLAREHTEAANGAVAVHVHGGQKDIVFLQAPLNALKSKPSSLPRSA